MPNWKQLSQDVLSLFLKPNCPVCGRSTETVLCPSCDRQLNQCQLSAPKFQGKDNISVLAWGKYDGLLKRAILALKYEKQVQLARPLGERLGKTWLEKSHRLSALNPLIIPIPLHPEKQKQRGFNQAELIARSFCQVTQLKLSPQGLKRTKKTAALYDLSPEARQKELAEAFTIGKGLNPKQNIILLDDIYTTGTTIQTAKMTLQKAGMNVLGVCALSTTKSLAPFPKKPEQGKIKSESS